MYNSSENALHAVSSDTTKCIHNVWGNPVQQVKENEKRNTPIYFNTNYHTEMKPVPIIMDYCLLQFDALKFFLGVPFTWGIST